MQERFDPRIQSLGQEDPLEKEMATHSSIRAWKIPWTEEPGGLQSTGLQRVGVTWWLNNNRTHQGYPYQGSAQSTHSTHLPVFPWKALYLHIIFKKLQPVGQAPNLAHI